MAVTNVGRVGFVHRGTYNPSTVYKRLDVVSYNNGTYAYNHNIALAGIVPTNGTYWEVMIDPTALNAATAAAQVIVGQAASAQAILENASTAILAANTATGNANAAATLANNAAGVAEDAAQLAQQTVANAIGAANATIANSLDASELSIADTIAAANSALNSALEDAENDVAAAVLLAEAATTNANEATTAATNAAGLATEIVLKKALITPRGIYSIQTTYYQRDLVTYEGTSYLYVNSNPAAGAPLNDSLYWMTMAAKGDGTGVNGLTVIDGKLYLTENGEVASNGVTLPQGGGSGGTTGGSVTLTNLMEGNEITVAKNAPANVSFNYVSSEDTGNGTVYIYVNELLKKTGPIVTGDNTLDVSQYVSEGTNTVRFYCSDVYGNYKNLIYTITVIDLRILSPFDSSIPLTGDFTYRYTPYGGIAKTIHFLLDGVEVGTSLVLTSGRQETKVINAPTHGVHLLEVYATASVGDSNLRSASLFYEVMCVVSGETTPMLASYYDVINILQGELINIPYVVYDPLHSEVEVTLTISLGQQTYSTQTLVVDRTKKLWTTRDYPYGTVTFTITCGSIIKTHTINVEQFTLPIQAVENDIQLHLTSQGRSNDEVNRDTWGYDGITTTFENVNWVDTGWVADENGDTVLRLNGPATATINIYPFAVDAKLYGKTIEIEFAIRNINNREAKPIKCLSGNVGFEVGADTAYFKSEQNTVKCVYKDEEKNRVSFVIEPTGLYRLMDVYLNGVVSGVTQYPTNDNLQQTNPAKIVIGSPQCQIDIYTIRIYNAALTREDIVNNYIADTRDVLEKMALYNENNLLFDDYGNLSITEVKKIIPVMVITGQLPLVKGDKRVVNITYTNPHNPQLNFENTAEIDVQGTSSQFYIRKNYKIKIQNYEADGSKTKIYIQPDVGKLPSNVFTMKADYAESTSTHNTQGANYVHDLYQELDITTPPQKLYDGIRTTVYGFPCVIYHRIDGATQPTFVGKYNFNYDKGSLSVYGFTSEFPLVESWEFLNNTSDSCLFKSEMDTSFTLDIDGEPVYAWVNDFEARQPEDYTDMTAFKIMHDWVVSTNQAAATNEELAEPYTDDRSVVHTVDNAAYRLAKFRTEFTQYFDMDFSTLYYLYTLVMLMSDQRAKNMFLTTWDGVIWQPWFYDNDTMLGINNEGLLAFDYYHEDIDQIGTANVYNGQTSVLWNNFREAFPTPIKNMYLNLRSSNALSYSEIIRNFITNGSDKWSMSIYNEDADYKYIDMVRTDNDASNLYQVRGTGEEHLRYFISNRIKYFDSKWFAPEFANDFLSLRIYTPSTWGGVEPNANITITPFSDMYAAVIYKANGTLQQQRAEKNTPTTFVAPNETFNDTETGVYGASQISSLGDLSPLYCGTINVSKADKLQELIVGSSNPQYENTNLIDLAVGANKLLKKVDVRGCVNLAQSLKLSECPNIEEVLADRTKITGVELTPSGYLKVLRLPETITSLIIKNQMDLETFYCAGYSNLNTLHIENTVGVPVDTILANATELQRVRLTDVNLTFSDMSALTVLANTMGIDELGNNTAQSVLTGTVVINTIYSDEITNELPLYQSMWPELTITYLNTVERYVVTFVDWDDTVLKVDKVFLSEAATPPPDPTREPDITSLSYTFDGWDTNYTWIISSRTVRATYTNVPRPYTVRWISNGVVLDTKNIGYGSYAAYANYPTIPTKTNGVGEDWRFAGWSPDEDAAPITEDTDFVAQFQDWNDTVNPPTIVGDYLFYQNSAVSTIPSTITKIGKNSYTGCSALTIASLPAGLTYIGKYAFAGNTNMTLTALPTGLTFIGEGAFLNTYGGMRATAIPDGITTIHARTFEQSEIRPYDLNNVTRIEDYGFYYSSVFENMNDIPSGITYIGDYALDTWGPGLINIPASLQYLGRKSFPKSLHTVYFLGTPQYAHP